MSREETELEEATRHVVEARKIVERQRRLIEHLKSFHVPTLQAEETLQTFEDNLAISERHERELRAKAGK